MFPLFSSCMESTSKWQFSSFWGLDGESLFNCRITDRLEGEQITWKKKKEKEIQHLHAFSKACNVLWPTTTKTLCSLKRKQMEGRLCWQRLIPSNLKSNQYFNSLDILGGSCISCVWANAKTLYPERFSTCWKLFYFYLERIFKIQCWFSQTCRCMRTPNSRRVYLLVKIEPYFYHLINSVITFKVYLSLVEEWGQLHIRQSVNS